MKIGQDISFKEALKNEAMQYGFVLTDKVLQDLERYKNLLLEWNEKINLTAITEEYDVMVKHFIDCLYCTKYCKEQDNIADIGTGAGFPGLVLAIYYQGKAKVTLMDALQKRILFLEQVINDLQLKNVDIIHARAEELGVENKKREHYDIVCARAVAPLNILLEYTSAYVKVGGRCIYMKGDNVQEEIVKAKKALSVLQMKIESKECYQLLCQKEAIQEVFTRYIITCKKTNSIDKKYPRSYSKIKKNPL